MTIKDGRRVKAYGHQTRKYRRAYTKCRKHKGCRMMAKSIWQKR